MPDTVKISCDVVVIGAGPAGLCAALRLLDLGYKVAIVERIEFPRAQIGESLSPGIRNIFGYLGLAHLLERPEYLQRLPARVIWNQPEPVYQPGPEKNGLIVDRSTLDRDLLAAAVVRGAVVLQPATVKTCTRVASAWYLKVAHNGKETELTAQVVLDGRGRKSVLKKERLETAAPMVALWVHIPASLLPRETRVEAIPNGWFWGSPLPNGTYRILLFVEPGEIKKNGAANVFNSALRVSRLFNTVFSDFLPEAIATCSVWSYLHVNPWEENYIRIGEAAFALDPLSSTGVEKAMRFSMQTAIAVNTLLKTGDVALAKAFYEEKLIESVRTHSRWTQEFYGQSWLPTGNSFWQTRRREVLLMPEPESALGRKWMLQAPFAPKENTGMPPSSIPVNILFNYFAKHQVTLCPKTSYQNTFSIAADIVELREAVHHPNLNQEIIFLDGIELRPLLFAIKKEMTFEELLFYWTTSIPIVKAKKLITFLFEKKILKSY